MSIRLDSEKIAQFDLAIKAMAAFKKTFGRELSPDFIAELYAARELTLELMEGSNSPGYDAVDQQGLRYEIKERKAQNVDVNNFDFDYLILINLDELYQLKGMWKLSRKMAEGIFTRREKFRKFQTTQQKFKSVAQRIR